MPIHIFESFWPSTGNGIVCRDGRMSQEKSLMEARADAENRPIIESKKSPKAILWRNASTGIRPAEFGDALSDSHGEFLVQTCKQNIQDYIHPVRLTIRSEQPIDVATTFLHQQAVPGLSLFHMSRLPGALYFADLVSKLTRDGWPKAIGRGFRVSGIVPPS